MEMTIGERIAYVRKHLSGGASTKDFGASIGVSDSMVLQYEKGASTPGYEVLAAICQKFLVSPGWLLLGAGEMRAPANLPFLRVVQDMIAKEQGAHGIFLHYYTVAVEECRALWPHTYGQIIGEGNKEQTG